MVYKTHSDVFIYHDETGKIKGRNVKGHVFLIIPNSLSVDRDTAQTNLLQLTEARLESLSPLNLLYEEILALRQKYEAFHKFHFSLEERNGITRTMLREKCWRLA
jgi:hypothetical protein